jgi:hypothetical protein
LPSKSTIESAHKNRQKYLKKIEGISVGGPGDDFFAKCCQVSAIRYLTLGNSRRRATNWRSESVKSSSFPDGPQGLWETVNPFSTFPQFPQKEKEAKRKRGG